MKKIIKLTESDLTRIVKNVISEGNIGSLNTISDEYLEEFMMTLSRLMSTKEFQDAEEILDKRVSNYGDNLGSVFEELWYEAVSRRRKNY
jgi:hypothetical protein